MDITADDLSILFFRKSIWADTAHVTMDADMIAVLLAIDENKDMRQVIKETGLEEATLRKTLTKLVEVRLIEPVTKSIRYLDRTFYDILNKNLTIFVGPLGEFILEDIMDEMGISPAKVPFHRTAELIRKAGEQIPDETNRTRFEEAMLKVIPT
jgi:hypothetical protein